MPISRTKFYGFLKKHALDQGLLTQALAQIDPFFAIARKGSFWPVPVEQLDASAIAAVLSRATRTAVNEIILVSINREERVYLLSESFEAYDVLLEKLPWGVIGRHKVHLEDLFFEVLSEHLLNTLEEIISGHLDEGRFEIGSLGHDCMFDTFYLYLAFVLHGRRAEAEKIEPLIQLFQTCVPLGRNLNAPGVWFVLGGI